MDIEAATSAIDREWSLDEGFLGRLRTGTFEPELFDRFLSTLRSIEAPSGCLPSRFVAVLWYAPIFMTWRQGQLVHPDDETTLQRATNEVHAEVERLLGVP